MMTNQTKRTTVYLDPELHKALRLKAVAVSRSFSDLVNEAVRESLKQDRHRYKLIRELTSQPGIDISRPKKQPED